MRHHRTAARHVAVALLLSLPGALAAQEPAPHSAAPSPPPAAPAPASAPEEPSAAAQGPAAPDAAPAAGEPAPAAAPEAPEPAAAIETPAPREAAPSRPAAAPSEAPAQEPRRGITGICGTVVDATDQEPLIDAPVSVVRGGSGLVRTDVDGRFEMRLAPGLYDLRARYELFQARRVNGVAVVAGECTPVAFRLSPESGSVEEVVVTARPDTRREAAVLAERKKAAVVQDTVSAQEISRTPDSTASDAVKRVVSATVVDGKYVFVRGLGGRYSSVLVNGVTLPSPEPDVYSVPLDLFPTSLLANLNVVKTWSPELPGGFAGGTLDIKTSPYPRDFEAEVGVSVAGNGRSTFQDVRTYDGGALDFLGFDDGTRAMPAAVSRDAPLLSRYVGPEAHERAGEAFDGPWLSREGSGMPTLGVGASVGNTLDLGGRKFGYLAALDYGHGSRSTLSAVRAPGRSTGGLFVREEVANDEGVSTADLSGLVNLGYELGPDDDLSFLALYTRSADSRAQRITGFSNEINAAIESTNLQFVARGMLFTQLRGQHRLPSLRDADVTWQGNVSWVSRDEPNTRDVTYQEAVPGVFTLRVASGSAEIFYSELDDVSGGGSAELSVPLGEHRLRAGVAAQLSSRQFLSRRFRYKGGVPSPLDQTPPDQIFTPDLIGTNSTCTDPTAPCLYLDESTQESDAYDASQQVYAGYVALDAQLPLRTRVVAGARYERAEQVIDPGSKFQIVDALDIVRTERSDDSILPTVNLVHALAEDMNLRAAYSYTVSRPQFRELAPFIYFDFARRRSVTGNPDLDAARIHNVDLRWEWLGEETVFAASAFFKEFERPIELTIQTPTQGDLSYQNAPSATVAGGELEARFGLGRLSPALVPLRAGLNVSAIWSEVDFSGLETKQTSLRRPLQGQSPYVVNASLSWSRLSTEVAVLYNVHGRRIAEAGNVGLPDVYEQPFHRLDLTAARRFGGAWKAKLSLTNLLDQRVVLEQGGVEVLSYRTGVAGSVSLEWSR